MIDDKKYLLKLLEDKNKWEDRKSYYLREYQEWVLNAIYKFLSLVTIWIMLIKFGQIFASQWWQEKLGIALLAVFLMINFLFLFRISGAFDYPKKIRNCSEQIDHLDQKIKGVLSENKEK